MQIVRRFKEVMGHYFEIKSPLGTYLIPDRLSDFNRLFQLYEEFFYNIYPKIVNQFNINSLMIEKNSNLLMGKVNWSQTITRNYLVDGVYSYPLQFTIVTSESSLQNPENVLFLSYIFRIGIDSKILKGYNFKDPLSSEEKLILENIIAGCNKLIKNPILQIIIQKAIEYANLPIYDRQLINLENKVTNRIKEGIIRQKGYNLLIDWIKKYKELNIRIISPNHTKFPVNNVKSLDTMFEIWVLFELLDFLTLHLSAKITKMSYSLNHFKITLNDCKFDLFYQKKYSGWARESEPDYTIEVDGILKVIMDAKNWSDKKDEAIYKMLGYINNLDGNVGVLFFPNVRDINKFEHKGLDLKNHTNQSIINCIFPLSGKDKIEQKKIQLEKLFKVIFAYIKEKKTTT